MFKLFTFAFVFLLVVGSNLVSNITSQNMYLIVFLLCFSSYVYNLINFFFVNLSFVVCYLSSESSSINSMYVIQVHSILFSSNFIMFLHIHFNFFLIILIILVVYYFIFAFLFLPIPSFHPYFNFSSCTPQHLCDYIQYIFV